MNYNTVIFSFTYGDLLVVLSILAALWSFLVAYAINQHIYSWGKTGWRNVSPAGWLLFLSVIPIWFFSIQYLRYFRQSYAFVVIILGVFFVFYAYEYALAFWRPIWKFEAWRRLRKDREKYEQALRVVNHSLKYVLMKLYIYWSWNGYDRNRHKLPKEKARAEMESEV